MSRQLRDHITILPQPELDEGVEMLEVKPKQGFVDNKGVAYHTPGRLYKYVWKIRGLWSWSLTPNPACCAPQ